MHPNTLIFSLYKLQHHLFSQCQKQIDKEFSLSEPFPRVPTLLWLVRWPSLMWLVYCYHIWISALPTHLYTQWYEQ